MVVYASFGVLLFFIVAGRLGRGGHATLGGSGTLGGLANRLTALCKRWPRRVLALITLACAALSLFRLGSAQTPVSFSHITGGEKAYVFDFQQETPLQYMMLRVGKNKDTHIALAASPDGENWAELSEGDMPSSSQFAWLHWDIQTDARYLRLTVAAENTQILELAFYENGTQALLAPRLVSGDAEVLDEQARAAPKADYTNGTVFDEYFYVTIGYDILHGYHPYDDAHPPLASMLIGLGMAVFGPTPFGWRLLSCLFGIATVPLLYAFARRLLGSEPLALFAAFLLASDLMRFVQSRVAVIEVFVVFFILFTFYFVLLAWQAAHAEGRGPGLRHLLSAGLCLGLAAACKWSGFFCLLALLPLCILLFRNEYKKRRAAGAAPGVLRYTAACTGAVLLCFAALPLLVYFLSYLPLMLQEGKGAAYFFGLHGGMASAQLSHAPVLPYISNWYEWAIVKTPFPYYNGAKLSKGGLMLRSAIVCFGNPLLWWLFIPAFLGLIALLLRKNTRRPALFLFLIICLTFMPWLFLGRIKFIYYFFMHLPFFILALCLCLKALLAKGWVKPHTVLVYAALLALCFGLYYPVLSGVYIHPEYATSLLQVLPGWVLI